MNTEKLFVKPKTSLSMLCLLLSPTEKVLILINAKPPFANCTRDQAHIPDDIERVTND